MPFHRTLIAPLGLALALSACASDAPPAGFAATLPPPPVPAYAKPADGAIFSPAAGYAPLHYGNRAARVGDVLTVLLVERTTTAKTVTGRTDRNGSITVTPPATGPFSFDPGAINSGAAASFNGRGNAAQTNQLAGTITVTVAQVLPNGVAAIRGEKLMRLSQGEEWVQLSGLIRFADIDADNRIFSDRIADAQIGYGGAGAVQRASQAGWLSRFFSRISPF